jgi:hypothetical protein
MLQMKKLYIETLRKAAAWTSLPRREFRRRPWQ